MIPTMRELREMIADHCDPAQPLRVVSYDVGKKAARHSVACADESHPATMTVTPGKYDERSVIELAHYPDREVLMPESALAAIDGLLEDHPKATIGWVYFFYFPLDYKGFFGQERKIENCLLDTRDVVDVYLADDDPNTLVIKAKFNVGSFDW